MGYLTFKLRKTQILQSLLTALLAIFFSRAYAAPANIEQQLRLQHHLDYQVPLTQATFIGTHNSYNAESWGYVPGGVNELSVANHKANPVHQLNAGFRVLNFDIHTHPSIKEEVLCHYAGNDSSLCSTSDVRLSFGLQELNDWLNRNPTEVVLLVIEDYIDIDRHDEAVYTIATTVGDKVFKPNGGDNISSGVCNSLAVGAVTKQEVLDAGKQLIIADGGAHKDCSVYSVWESWVWHLASKAFKGNLYEGETGEKCSVSTVFPYYTCKTINSAAITRYSDKLSFLYEDRAAGDALTDAKHELSGEELSEALEMGAAVVGLDMALDIDRRESAVWSWDTHEPRNDNAWEDCAYASSTGKWSAKACSANYRFACQNRTNGKWRVSPNAGAWQEGDTACQSLGSDYFFSVPVNANQNKALKDIADFESLWLNYSDQDTEGEWVAVHYWNTPAIDRTPALKISLKSTHGTYVRAHGDGATDASSTSMSSRAKFDVIYNSDSTLSLRSSHGMYVSALSNGGLNADSYTIGTWEKFRLVPLFGTTKFAIASQYGRYLVAEDSGAMNADRTVMGDRTAFDVITHKTASNARWPFDSDLNDRNNNANGAAPVGGTSLVQGVINNAISFNGTNRYAEIPNSGYLNFGRDDNFTIAVWVRAFVNQPDSSRKDNAIIEKWDGEEGYPYVIRYYNGPENAGKIMVARYDGSNNPTIVSKKSLADEEFHHIAFVKHGNRLKLYVDGILEGETKDTITGDTLNGSAVFLGRRGSSSAPIRFNGEIDDLRIYNHAISAEQLTRLLATSDYGIAPRIDHNTGHVAFNTTFEDFPPFFANMQTFNGSDTAELRMYPDNSAEGFHMLVQEEQSRDSEIAHAREDVSYAAFNAGMLINKDGHAIGEVGTFSIDQWERDIFAPVTTLRDYNNPIVILTINTRLGTQPAHMRLDSVYSTAFFSKLEEWDYLDGAHALETVSYMVVERGTHVLNSGVVLKADKTSVNTAWETIGLQNTFSETPVVLSQVQTMNDPQAVVTRMRNVTASGFEVRLQEQELFTDGHANETVGFVAIGK